MLRAILAAAFLAALITHADAQSTPVRPFKSDGCSGGVSRLYKLVHGEDPPYQACCVAHDKAYWRGGTSDMRADADEALRVCVVKYRSPVWASIMKWAVKLGGQPFFPFDWRRGYGRDYAASWWYDRT